MTVYLLPTERVASVFSGNPTRILQRMRRCPSAEPPTTWRSEACPHTSCPSAGTWKCRGVGTSSWWLKFPFLSSNGSLRSFLQFLSCPKFNSTFLIGLSDLHSTLPLFLASVLGSYTNKSGTKAFVLGSAFSESQLKTPVLLAKKLQFREIK